MCLRGDERFKSNIAWRRGSGEEFVRFVVWRESRTYARGVLFVVLVESVVEGDGMVWIVQRNCAVDDCVGSDGLLGSCCKLRKSDSF